ncbi:hypothetical protein D3C71_1622140 [compost metagenome]
MTRVSRCRYWSVRNNTLRMGEYLEILASGESDQRDAGGLGGADRKRCRCRHRYQDGASEHRGLLHHLDRNAAGHDNGSLVALDGSAKCKAAKFIERIVPADVFACRDEACVRQIEAGGVNGSGFAMKLLRAV